MRRIAVISAILENPERSQVEFNTLISSFKGLIKGRMGLPMPEYCVTVIVITLVGDLNEINSLTGKIGLIPGIQVKTSISKKDI
ncbi:MAG: TM1266 family iron-only hydrogenase system putative regulator [Christensenellales bacterium]|jgi:putative iron-only hydrogenase system regulator